MSERRGEIERKGEVERSCKIKKVRVGSRDEYLLSVVNSRECRRIP